VTALTATDLEDNHAMAGRVRRPAGHGGRPATEIPVTATQAEQPRAPGARWRARAGTMPPVADGFTARPETMPGLLAALGPGAVVALVPETAGQSGPSCGKTQLAVLCAESLWRSGQAELLAWVDASSRASLLSGYAEAAAASGIEPSGTAEQVAARLTGWLAGSTLRWLVVLDDLRNPADLDGLWPGGPAGTVLITTRHEEAAAGQPGVRVVPVGALSTREALSYLTGRLADDRDQRGGAIDLAITLGGDPTALTCASAVIASSTLTCRDYQQHYTGKQAQLQAQRADSQPPAAPEVTWMLSADRAGELSPGGATRLLLGLAGLLDGRPIPGTVLTAPAVCQFLAQAGIASGPDHAWDAVRALEDTGLLVTDPATTPPLVRIPQAVVAQARAGMPARTLHQAVRAAAAALLHAWAEPEPAPWLAAVLRGCADALDRTAGDLLWAGQGCHPVLLRAGHSLDAARLTGPAAAYWAQLAATSDRIHGPGNPGTLAIGSHLARALLAAGQGPQAIAWSHWVAADRARTLGNEHPAAIAAQVDLGHALAAAGQPGHAVTVLTQAAADSERLHGAGHRSTLRARGELAAACQAVGHHDEAIACYQHILAGRERLHGSGHPGTITARDQLAAACLAASRYRDAITQYEHTLAGLRRDLGSDHPDTIAARRRLTRAYQTAGQIAAALQQHEQVCAGLDRVLGPGHPDTLASRANLANAYYAAGRLTDAATLHRDILTHCDQALPPGHPLTTALRLAMTSISQG